MPFLIILLVILSWYFSSKEKKEKESIEKINKAKQEEKIKDRPTDLKKYRELTAQHLEAMKKSYKAEKSGAHQSWEEAEREEKRIMKQLQDLARKHFDDYNFPRVRYSDYVSRYSGGFIDDTKG